MHGSGSPRHRQASFSSSICQAADFSAQSGNDAVQTPRMTTHGNARPVPLAATGGFIGLALTDLFIAEQPLDIITMLGFIMLVGTVVNNPILLVYQALNYIKLGMNGKAAVRLSLKTRIRPISMSTATSLFGMLPLVVAPGAGSELYRGMGSVILGGLALSTVFTMFIIPALLSFFLEKVEGNDHLPEGYIDD